MTKEQWIEERFSYDIEQEAKLLEINLDDKFGDDDNIKFEIKIAYLKRVILALDLENDIKDIDLDLTKTIEARDQK